MKHQDQYRPVEQNILGFLCDTKTKMTWDTVLAFNTLFDTFRDVQLACNHTMRTSSRPVTGRSDLEDGRKVVELYGCNALVDHRGVPIECPPCFSGGVLHRFHNHGFGSTIPLRCVFSFFSIIGFPLEPGRVFLQIVES